MKPINSRILVTGGCGYIGSHVLIELLELKYDVVVIDDLSNSSAASLKRVEEITGKKFAFVQGTINDEALLDTIFSTYQISAVIHLAGLKSPIESMSSPLSYYDNNLNGSITLCRVMARHKVKRIIFSSSATVYGDVHEAPVKESCITGNTNNPYGTSKYMVERILHDLCVSDTSWSATALRYFNPIGAHPSGLIGESSVQAPNNLMPYLLQVAAGEREFLTIFGNDYPTHDGTGVRDYLHVVDLAKGHIAALESDLKGFNALNLGTGTGFSVLDVIHTFEEVCLVKVPYQFAARRHGDVASCYANPDHAAQTIHWQARLSLKDMLRDAWRWQVSNTHYLE